MFGRKRHRVQASATVVSATFVKSGSGWNESEYDFVVDVASADGATFRQTVRQRALSDQHPKAGDTLTVGIDPRDHSVVLELDDDPRYRTQDPDEAHAFNERCAANLDEITALERNGTKATAVLEEVDECGWMRALGQREFAVVATVSPPGAAEYQARFSIFDTTSQGLYTPVVGQTIAVVIDPADPTRVRAGTFWSTPSLEALRDEVAGAGAGGSAGVRWRVPSECPNCGAPVDQSTESMAVHPTCHMCRAPLPCEPA